MKHPILERQAEEGAARFELPPLGQMVHDTHIGEVELRCLDDPPLGTLAERRQETAQKRVHEDLEILLHSIGRDATIARDRLVVDQLSVGERRRVQELRERRQIAGKPFRCDFLLEVVVHVGMDAVSRCRVQVVRRQ